jgi:hypothetical protein
MKTFGMTPHARARIVLLALAAAAIASLPTSAAASAGRPATTPAGLKICGTFKGPHWSYKGFSSTQYIVYTRRGGTCGLAMEWAPKLVSKSSHAVGYVITGGPAGWICANSIVHFGTCAKTVNGHPTATSGAFAWAGDTRK